MSGADLVPPVVRLWWSTLRHAQPYEARLLSLLDAGERRRAEGIRVEQAGRRFIASRAMLRLLLAQLTGGAPDEVTFVYGDHGKPRLASGPPPHFSLAHSAETIVIAVADQELGVDVEERRKLVNAARLAPRICTGAELDTLRSLPEAEAGVMLLRLWTAKEAVLKGIGSGIAGGMQSVEVEGDPASLHSEVRVRGDVDDWTIRPVPLPVDAVCTVAVHGTDWRMDVANFDWDS